MCTRRNCVSLSTFTSVGPRSKHPHRPRFSALRNGFHTFGLWWKPDEYVFYVDGKETWRSKAGGVCQVPEYMLLSDEIGLYGAIRIMRRFGMFYSKKLPRARDEGDCAGSSPRSCSSASWPLSPGPVGA